MSRPKTDYSMTPRLSLASFGWSKSHRIDGLGEPARRIAVSSGRLAIDLAFRMINPAAGSEVLVPAYHCDSVVEPLLQHGLKPVYYRLNQDLTPDMIDVESKTCGRTAAIFGIHFFGFPQDFSNLVSVSRKHEISLVEDCAHCLAYGVCGSSVGSYGDFVTFSTRKFYPMFDGGVLLVRDGTMFDKVDRPRSDLRYELQCLYNTLGAVGVRSADASATPAVVDARDDHRSRDGESVDETADSRTGGEYSDPRFRVGDPVRSMSVVGKVISSLASTIRIAAIRRRNYEIIADAVSRTRHMTLFFESLPDRTVPYVVPVLLADGKRRYEDLKRAGVPMFRWEDFAEHECPVADAYRWSLVQLPCHQDLSLDDVGVLSSRLQEVLNR